MDQGKIISSDKGDDWNAIDPNVVLDEQQQPWLSFGSFWGGIKLRKLELATGQAFLRRSNFILSGDGHERQSCRARLKLLPSFAKITITTSSFLSTSVVVEKIAPTTFAWAERGGSLGHTSIEAVNPWLMVAVRSLWLAAVAGLGRALFRFAR